MNSGKEDTLRAMYRVKSAYPDFSADDLRTWDACVVAFVHQALVAARLLLIEKRLSVTFKHVENMVKDSADSYYGWPSETLYALLARLTQFREGREDQGWFNLDASCAIDLVAELRDEILEVQES